MELENTNGTTEVAAPNPPLTEPHFDDEATVLSARPVVPLSEVQASRRGLPRVWLFVLTIIVAMTLGALASVLYISHNSSSAGNSSLTELDIIAGAAGEATASTPTQAPAAFELKEKTEARNRSAEADAQPATPDPETETEARKPVARRVEVLTSPSSREERKAARRLAREMERQDRKNRDLTRIREIFEGTERP